MDIKWSFQIQSVASLSYALDIAVATSATTIFSSSTPNHSHILLPVGTAKYSTTSADALSWTSRRSNTTTAAPTIPPMIATTTTISAKLSIGNKVGWMVVVP
jgi:hypothetical protein